MSQLQIAIPSPTSEMQEEMKKESMEVDQSIMSELAAESAAQTAATNPIRRRGPAPSGCNPCRRRRVRCSKDWPACLSCQRRGEQDLCQYEVPPAKSSQKRPKLTETVLKKPSAVSVPKVEAVATDSDIILQRLARLEQAVAGLQHYVHSEPTQISDNHYITPHERQSTTHARASSLPKDIPQPRPFPLRKCATSPIAPISTFGKRKRLTLDGLPRSPLTPRTLGCPRSAKFELQKTLNASSLKLPPLNKDNHAQALLKLPSIKSIQCAQVALNDTRVILPLPSTMTKRRTSFTRSPIESPKVVETTDAGS